VTWHERTAVYWSDPSRVEKFAAREPDVRLGELLTTYPDPGRVRALDLGCAAGRNTVLLAEKGFDVWAVDLAPGMVSRTRERLAMILGRAEAERRVREGRMDALQHLGDGSVALVVALGVYQMAKSEIELDRAFHETHRVLEPRGLVLSATHAPGVRFENRVLEPVEGARFLHRDADGDTVCLLAPDALDAEMARHGFEPVVPTVCVTRQQGVELRVVTNALHRRRG